MLEGLSLNVIVNGDILHHLKPGHYTICIQAYDSSNRWAAQTPIYRGFLVKTVVFTVFDREIISNRELFLQRIGRSL